jgi:hypothetical protein
MRPALASPLGPLMTQTMRSARWTGIFEGGRRPDREHLAIKSPA